MNFRTLKTSFTIDFTWKTPGMHFYCCNDAVPWLNKAKSRIFWCTVIFKNFQIHLYFVCHLPACCKTQFRYVYGSNFLTKNVIGIYNMNLLFRKRLIHCTQVIPFMLHWPSLFFSKVNNSWKKVLITPGLYFPNYCITYLQYHVILKMCEHVNLRVEWMRVASIWGVVLRSKQSEDSWQKEGRLSRSFRERLCWQCSTKPWQLHERPGEKLCTKQRKLYEGSGKESCWQYSMKPQKLHEGSWKESCWHCCSIDSIFCVPGYREYTIYGCRKPRNLQWRLGEESLK